MFNTDKDAGSIVVCMTRDRLDAPLSSKATNIRDTLGCGTEFRVSARSLDRGVMRVLLNEAVGFDRVVLDNSRSEWVGI